MYTALQWCILFLVMAACVVCLEEGVALLRTVCSGTENEVGGKKHESVICFRCMHSLCATALKSFTTPKCPLCRRQIFFDCLVALGWKHPGQVLVERFKTSMSMVEPGLRVQEGLASHDVLTPVQHLSLCSMKRCITELTNMLGFAFMYFALHGFVPGPVYEVSSMADDSHWEPKSNQVFYTVLPNLSPRSLMVITWNGPQHGMCLRVGISSTGARILHQQVLPFFHPMRLLWRKQKWRELQAATCTRSKTEAMHQLSATVNAEMYESLLLLAPDLF